MNLKNNNLMINNEEKEDDRPVVVSSSESIINQITLDCLLNKSQYERYLQRNLIKNINKNDKKFYRKRIINLTKELYTEENNSILPPDIKYIFENYVKVCVNYFKVLDRSDILQEEYKELNDDTAEVYSEIDQEELNLSNSLLMRSIKINSGLDDFVKVKMIKQKDTNMIIPHQKDVNLRDPKLRKKGIIEKDKEKKNITIKYDDQEEKTSDGGAKVSSPQEEELQKEPKTNDEIEM